MITIKKFIPGIAWFFLVLILICLPGDDLPKTGDWMAAVYFDKWVHVGLFFILTFLFMIPICKSKLPEKIKWNVVIKIALSACIWGITTEFIQKFFIVGRAFDLFDWAADTAGIFFATALCKILYFK